MDIKKIEEEIASRIKEIEEQLHALQEEKRQLEESIFKLRRYHKYEVGNLVQTNRGENGKVVSIDGPEKCHVLVLIRRRDINVDMVTEFDDYGRHLGYDGTYTISIVKKNNNE